MAEQSQLHTMKMEGNVMRMREVSGIDVPSGKSVELKPGGYHIMFLGLKQPLKVGEHIPITLHFEKAGDVNVDMQVMKQAMPSGQQMHMK